MKKVLLGAVLFGGTVLGFAKDNGIDSNENLASVIEEKKEIKASDEDEARKICTTIYTWETTDTYYNIQTQAVHSVTTTHMAQTTSWCGDNAPRTTFVNGNPN